MTDMNADLFIEAYRCKICRTMIHHRRDDRRDSNTAKLQFWPHLNEHHPELLTESKRARVQSNFEMCCATCEQPFASRAEVQAHVKTAHPKHRVNQAETSPENALNHKIVFVGKYGQPRLTIRIWMVLTLFIVLFVGFGVYMRMYS